MKATILSGQSLLDVVVQECGGMEDLFLLARKNDVSITDVLVAGQIINIPDAVCNRLVTDYFKNNRIKPSTAGGTDSLIKHRVFSKVFSKVFA